MVDCIRNARDNTGDANDARRLTYQGLILPSKAGGVAMVHVTYLVEER